MSISPHESATEVPVGDSPATAPLSDLDLSRALAATAARLAAAEAAAIEAAEEMADLLTERLARVVAASHPTADSLFVQPVYRFCPGLCVADGGRCCGHDPDLAPIQVVDVDGIDLGDIDAFHPARYLLERLTGLLGVERLLLDLTDRRWYQDCTDD